MRVCTPLMILSVLCGCKSTEKRTSMTPEGYEVAWEGKPTTAEILAEFDASMAAAIAHLAKYGVTPVQTTATARQCRFNIKAGSKFPSKYSPTGMAAGETWIRERVVQVAWDTNPASNRHVPALGHELGHIIFGEKFEHGWAPPLK